MNIPKDETPIPEKYQGQFAALFYLNAQHKPSVFDVKEEKSIFIFAEYATKPIKYVTGVGPRFILKAKGFVETLPKKTERIEISDVLNFNESQQEQERISNPESQQESQ